MPSILTPDIEKKLNKELSPLWMAMNPDGKPRYMGTQIAEMLGFGEPGPYKKLKPYHVYYYRRKFKLPQRADHYKHGSMTQKTDRLAFSGEEIPKIIKDTMEIEKFKVYIQKIGEKEESREFYNKRKRAYLILLFWSGLRKSEIYDMIRQEFEIHPDRLRLKIIRKKKRKKEVGYLNLPRTMWGIDEAIEWITQVDKNNRLVFRENDKPFNISSTTAWKYVKEMVDELYPHWFRANLVTDMANDPEMTIAKMRSWFGFSYATIEHYLGSPERLQRIEAMKRAKASAKP